ncbi:MAG: hypothetical protein H6736_20130 [Alphaproteobacteria bacterium]|nr:hypothetical protein [Alphaproteobacteria bacterium]
MTGGDAIWVIDDDPSDRELTLMALREVVPSRVTRGFSSLRSALATLAEGERPGLIFVDWTLPGEDTRAAPARIRAFGAKTCLLTNLDCALIAERTLFDAWASKPYGFDALCSLLRDAIQRTSEGDSLPPG